MNSLVCCLMGMVNYVISHCLKFKHLIPTSLSSEVIIQLTEWDLKGHIDNEYYVITGKTYIPVNASSLIKKIPSY